MRNLLKLINLLKIDNYDFVTTVEGGNMSYTDYIQLFFVEL